MANAALLGAAQSFAVLGATTVTNTGASAIFGDLGVSPGTAITGFPPGVVTGGSIHAGDAVATQAHADLATAYTTVSGEVSTTDLNGDLGGLTLTPGVYRFETGAALSGTLTLDAQNNPDAEFTILIGTTLITSSNSSVQMINGARGDNIFFRVGSSATLGANTAFAGNILANTSVTLTTGASITDGRALAVNAAVTMDTNSVSIPPVFISIDDVTGLESIVSGSLTFTISLSRPSGQSVTVDLSTANGTAIAPADYASTTTTLTFLPGVLTQSFSVAVVNDALDEPDETFFVDLSAPVNATIADPQGLGTILDDDAAPSIVIDDVSIQEGNAGQTLAVFTVSLSAASGRDVTVAYATSGGTAVAGLDYAATSGTLTILAGSLTGTVSVPILGDALDEPDETFFVDLSAPVNATIADPQGLGTILDDDAAPSLSVDDVSLLEADAGQTLAVFTVTLSAVSGRDVTVGYSTASGTAVAGLDYAATSGTLTILAGSLTGTVSVPIIGDSLDEPDETFLVGLSAPVNATIADPQGLGTILDDDAAPSLSVNDVSLLEGNAGQTLAVFTVTLSAASGRDLTVGYSTASGTAVAGLDYTATSGTLTILAGSLTWTVSVPILGDVLDEPDETFFLNLTGPVNATIADPQGVGTILDDDATPSLAIDNLSIQEGNVGQTLAGFTVTLSAASSRDVTVAYATSGGTAVAGLDYAATSGTLTILAGSLTGTISVPIIGDSLDEPDETFLVGLSAPVNATIADPQGLGTILDDDATPPVVENFAPVSRDDSYNSSQSVGLSPSKPGVLANDTDAEGVALTAVLVSGPAHGTLVLNLDGSFLYTPEPSFLGVDSFTYRSSDGVNQSNVATATITVRDVTGPIAQSLVRFGFHAAPTVLVLTFNEALDPAKAGNVAAYQLFGPTGPIRLRSAVYDAETHTVTLRPERLLRINSQYRLMLDQSASTGIADIYGNVLVGEASLGFSREALRTLATKAERQYSVPVAPPSSISRQLNKTLSSARYLRLLGLR